MDGDSTGVSAKLKSLDQELSNLEKVGKGDLSKIPSLLRKQAKRYQSLTGKIDDLCRKMVSWSIFHVHPPAFFFAFVLLLIFLKWKKAHSFPICT